MQGYLDAQEPAQKEYLKAENKADYRFKVLNASYGLRGGDDMLLAAVLALFVYLPSAWINKIIVSRQSPDNFLIWIEDAGQINAPEIENFLGQVKALVNSLSRVKIAVEAQVVSLESIGYNPKKLLAWLNDLRLVRNRSGGVKIYEMTEESGITQEIKIAKEERRALAQRLYQGYRESQKNNNNISSPLQRYGNSPDDKYKSRINTAKALQEVKASLDELSEKVSRLEANRRLVFEITVIKKLNHRYLKLIEIFEAALSEKLDILAQTALLRVRNDAYDLNQDIERQKIIIDDLLKTSYKTE